MAEGSSENNALEGASFPLYRMLIGSGHYYRIEGPRRFTEIQQVGSKAVVHRIEDAAYPEQVRIQEMIACANGRYGPMNGEDWERKFGAI